MLPLRSYLEAHESDACFASNQFSRAEALQFVNDLERMGWNVTYDTRDLYPDLDGPGQDYLDTCYVSQVPGVESAALGQVMWRIRDEKPDEVDWIDLSFMRLWWD